MRKQSLEFLEALLNTHSPSGEESAIQALCRDYIKPYVDKTYKDVHGNQYCVRNPKGKLRVMLAGHVDEIALMVNHIDEKGFLGFVAVGGIDPSVLDGQRVRLATESGPVPGVIGRRAIHLMEQEERGKPMKLHQMWIDIGAKDREEAENLVRIGDTATIDAGTVQLLNDRMVGRAMDDRIGAFIVLEATRLLAKRKLNVAVHTVTTVQEEIGLRGATSSSYQVEPHAALAVDVSHATDHPDCDNKRFGATRLGAGPIIDRGPNISPVVFQQLVEVARKEKIPYQVNAEPRATGTDANPIQISRGGVATGIIGVPNRYMHSPVEMVSLEDVENCARLIEEWVCTLKPGMDFTP